MRNNKGFSAIHTILFISLLTGLVCTGWYVYQKNLATNKDKLSNSSKAKPNYGWKVYHNEGDEFRLYYPANWKVRVSTAPYEPERLQTAVFSSTDTPDSLTVYENLAAKASDGTVISHLIPSSEIISQNTITIGGVLANLEVDKVKNNKYRSYIFWHQTMLLVATMNMPSNEQSPEVDTFDQVAKSICFSDFYSSGKCVSY